ncbi:MAG TPA: sulfatase-like hydrolase/transferase [Polyangiaceae bacterium]|nr:sulfatase-like hydrolase/transferase [Polyangiaceae bacterium]
MFNARYPLPEPAWASLLPSVDTTAVLACFLVLARSAALRRGQAERRIASAAFWGLAFITFVVRLFRVGDGIAEVFMERHANLFVDAVLLPEVIRLLYSTLPLLQFSLVILGLLICVPLSIWLAYRAWRATARDLAQREVAASFLVITLALGVVGWVRPKPIDHERYARAFSASVLPRVRDDMNVFLQARELRVQREARLRLARARFAESKGDLAKLEGANVLLFVVESYGVTVLRKATYVPHTEAMYAAFESALSKKGFQVVSNLLDSPTTGGGSWLAHASMLSGMRVADQDDYQFMVQAEPRSLVWFFAEAGYYTVSAEPGTQRQSADPYHFEQRIWGPKFGYRGPKFTWAPMPDQFIIDRIHRTEVLDHPEPKFIKYTLVSSHAPWSQLPPVLENWNDVGDGSIYRSLPKTQFPTSWTNLSQAQLPYMRSVEYSMEVIRRYLEEFVDDDSLVIVLGDHQPSALVTDRSPDMSVPIHIVSRNRDFLRKFEKRGYVPGMKPALNRRRVRPLESFPGDLLEDFSTRLGEAGRAGTR